MESRIFFKNIGNMKFADQAAKAGIEDYLIAPSTAVADFDNDGDIDLLSNKVSGPVIANWNAGQAIIINLQDCLSNLQGIGSNVTIKYDGEKSLHQMHELQLSGGFNALDAPNANANSGFGEYRKIDAING